MTARPSRPGWFWRCLGGFVLLACAGPRADTVQPATLLRSGLLLYAAPGMGDSRFAETVVLLIQHGEDGSMGVVINRPTDVPLHRALRGLGSDSVHGLLYWGGPVQPDAIQALVRAPLGGAGARTVVRGVQITSDMQTLRERLADPRGAHTVRIYSGYAGWGPGQLAGELRRRDWVIDHATAGPVFAPDPSVLWPRVRLLLDSRQACGSSPAVRPWTAGRASCAPRHPAV